MSSSGTDAGRSLVEPCCDAPSIVQVGSDLICRNCGMVHEQANVIAIHHDAVDTETRLERILTKRGVAAIKVAARRSCRTRKVRNPRQSTWGFTPKSRSSPQPALETDTVKEKVKELLSDLFPGEPLHPWTGDLGDARSWRIPRWSEAYDPSTCWLNFVRKRH